MPRLGLGHRSGLGRILRAGSSQGFTLVELVVVVVMIGILASLSVGSVLDYTKKARASTAKALVASAARECVRWMVDSEGLPFRLGTTPGEGYGLLPEPPECGGGQSVSFEVSIDAMPGSAFGIEVNSDGSFNRFCTGSLDCVGGRW